MRVFRGTLRLLIVGLLLADAGVLLSGCAYAPPVLRSDPRPLRILLTNDDGYAAAGIRAQHDALVAAGHDVTIVAPSRNRSGSSMSLTTHGELTLQEKEPGIWAVGGTPADSVHVGLAMVFDEPPDLVVSGVNFGQNVGARTIASGTVGAAVAAAMLGIPAIAISQAVAPRNVELTPRYFPDAAAFTVDLIDAISASSATHLLPKSTVLNVNHPPRHASELAGVMVTRQGRSVLYRLVYERAPSGNVSMDFERTTDADPANADTTALAAGYVSITPIDGDWSASDRAVPGLESIANQLSRPAAASAPPP